MTNIQSYTPVQLRSREDGWTPARQWEFLQTLGETGSVKLAAIFCTMSERSAQRLRKHPDAESFRIAWDAALANAWRRVDEIAVDRMINGEVETIERDGVVVATRRRPCSDKLLIHMLQEQVRRVEKQAADLAVANKALAAKARDEALIAGARAGGRVSVAAAVKPVTPGTVATRETDALRDFHNRVQALPDSTGWDTRVEDLDGAAPVVPLVERWLAPADGRIGVTMRAARLRNDAAAGRHGAEAMRDGDAERSRKVTYSPLASDFPTGDRADRQRPDGDWGKERSIRVTNMGDGPVRHGGR